MIAEHKVDFDESVPIRSFIRFNGANYDYYGQIDETNQRNGFGRTCWYNG